VQLFDWHRRICRSSSCSLTSLLTLDVNSSSVKRVLCCNTCNWTWVTYQNEYVTMYLYRVPTGKFMLQFGALFLCLQANSYAMSGTIGFGWLVGFGYGSINSPGSGFGLVWSVILGGLGWVNDSSGLCGACVQCLWSPHFTKEKSSLQETSEQSFSESEQQVLRLTVFDGRALHCVNIQGVP